MVSSRATGSQLQPLPSALGAYPHSIERREKRSCHEAQRVAKMCFTLTACISTN
ncbi:MAG: hypothetical protein ACI95C_001778 [Pseudohongiellaceae bacterium]|jgi:hypothetical protein